MLGLVSCSDPPQFAVNQVEFLRIQRQQQAKQATFDLSLAQDVQDILAALFGTPDAPRFPYLLGDDEPLRGLVDIEKLRQAAGPVNSDRRGHQQGLYREHCAQCHGISGDGAGPTSGFLNPYPRDFRLGKFKYKSTKLGIPPTDEDLRQVLVNGIPGTAMPAFRTLPENELAALIDYVKYLTIRGQVEYRMIAEAAALDPGKKLVDWEWRRGQTNFDPEPGQLVGDPARHRYDDQLSLIVEDGFLAVVEKWNRRQKTAIPPVPDWLVGPTEAVTTRIAEGRALFTGKANCSLCHGLAGLGDGQTENYDDWTSHWVKGANVDPRNAVACAPFIDAGAFPPRPIRPRNLRLRVYRGGDRFTDLYRRIANGIEGTGMPDSSALTEAEIWALVAYVVNLPYEGTNSGWSAERAAGHETLPDSAGPAAGAAPRSIE
jgi:mono/diheme cytochrome c family protein